MVVLLMFIKFSFPDPFQKASTSWGELLEDMSHDTKIASKERKGREEALK